jgi:hypothetical protein
MVTALEDIGIGNCAKAIALIFAATNAGWRRMLGGEVFVLDRVLADACGAVKDRSGDHIGSIVHHEPALNAEFHSLKSASRAALLAILAMSSLPPLYGIRAALIAAGRQVRVALAATHLTTSQRYWRHFPSWECLKA